MKRVAVALILILAAANAHADTRADARRYFQQGMQLIDEGKLNEGIDLLKKAYTIRPHPSVLFNIARAYVTQGRVDQAVDYFEQYLASDPADAEVVKATLNDLKDRQKLRNLVDEGMAAIADGRYAEGISLLRRAYDARPHPNILFNMARAYEDSQDYKRAIATYERYLKSSPRDEEDVKNTLKKLRTMVAKQEAPKIDRERERQREKEREKERERAKKPAIVEKQPPVETPVEKPVVVAELDEERMEKLAQMIAQLMKKDAEAAAAENALAENTGEPREQTIAKNGADNSARAAATEAMVSAVNTSTSVTAPPALEAKSGEAYEEKVVTASRREQSPLDAPNAVTIITEEDIRLSGARSIPDLLRRVPGMDVMAMSYSDYNVSMRGFNRRVANKILVLVDGRTIYEDFLGGMLWRGQTFDLLDVQRIEVVRGPGSAIYGAYAYTGMVNIITKRPEEISGSVAEVRAGNGDTVEATYQYGERHGPVGIRASVGYERGNKYELEFDPTRVDFTTNVENPMISLNQVRFDLNGEYNLKNENGRVFLGGGARSGFTELYGVAALRNQAIDGKTYSVRGGYEGDLFSLLAFWNGLRAVSTPQFYRTGLNDLGSTVRADIISVEPIFRPGFTLLGEHALVIGGEYRHKFIEWDYLDGSHEEDHFAVFAQDSWTLNKAFSVIASARLDLHPIIGPLASPRIALIVKPAERQALRISFGTAFRQPTQAETYLNLSASSPVAGVAVTLVGGQDSLEPENIATLDVGYLLQPDFGELEAVAYVNRVGNLISRTPLVPTGIDTSFNPEVGAFIGAVSNYINDPRHYLAIGSELSARLYPIEGVDVGASYALQYIFDEDTGDRYTDSPLHKATLWGQLRTSFGMDAALSAHFVSSQKWVEPNYDPASPTGFNADPLPVDASIVLIGRLGYRLLDDKLEIGVSGTNLTDFGSLRHREHPYANRVEARVLGSLTARF